MDTTQLHVSDLPTTQLLRVQAVGFSEVGHICRRPAMGLFPYVSHVPLSSISSDFRLQVTCLLEIRSAELPVRSLGQARRLILTTK